MFDQESSDWVVRAYCTTTQRHYYWCDSDGEWTPIADATRYTWWGAEMELRKRLTDYGMSHFTIERAD